MQLSRLIGLHSPLLSMDCDCHWSADDLHLRYQYISDFFIALAYFSIPLELIYFVKKSAVFPYRWVLVQFGAFIVLCGATHLINLWTLSAAHSPLVATVMTVSKVLTAVVSCATALMLVHIIPDLLSVKTRELFLKNKAAELDREMGMIRTQEETGRSVRMLTQEIRSTLDRHTILNTTMVELGKALALEECGLWMPTRKGTELQLTHTLMLQKQAPKIKNGGGNGNGNGNGGGGGRTAPLRHLTVPFAHPTVKQVLGSRRAVSLPSDSPLAVMTRPDGAVKYAVSGDAVAMRVPLLHLNNFRIVCDLQPSIAAASSSDRCSAPFALMVLVLPSDSARRWHVHELELVEVVAEQVAVALSHAAILEESIKARDLLMQQNVALDLARREAETAVRARHNFLDVMNHEMRTPTHAIIAFSSLLLETGLTHEQRSMVDTIHKSSNLLGTLINDVLDLSRLDEGSLELDVRTFNVPLLFREVLNLVKPIVSVKKLALALHLDPDVPDYARGDDKRLLQITLNLVGNAIKFTEDGSVALIVSMERRELLAKDLRAVAGSEPRLVLHGGDGHYYLRVQVRDTGMGVNPSDIPKLFSKVSQYGDPASRSYATAGLGLAICKRFVKLMDGHIWIESAGIGKGSSVTFVVKLQVPARLPDRAHSGPLLLPAASIRTSFTGLKALVVDDNMVNRRVTKGLLARLGCDVTTVGSGRDALLMLSQPSMMMTEPPFALLFVDILMPEMDGFELVVRAEELFPVRSKRPLIIAVTASTDPSVRERCFSVGMDGILLKPFSLEKLRSMLNELLDRGLVER